jgi:hypothetical protein
MLIQIVELYIYPSVTIPVYSENVYQFILFPFTVTKRLTKNEKSLLFRNSNVQS